MRSRTRIRMTLRTTGSTLVPPGSLDDFESQLERLQVVIQTTKEAIPATRATPAERSANLQTQGCRMVALGNRLYISFVLSRATAFHVVQVLTVAESVRKKALLDPRRFADFYYDYKGEIGGDLRQIYPQVKPETVDILAERAGEFVEKATVRSLKPVTWRTFGGLRRQKFEWEDQERTS